jgi:hypothetical protein
MRRLILKLSSTKRSLTVIMVRNRAAPLAELAVLVAGRRPAIGNARAISTVLEVLKIVAVSPEFQRALTERVTFVESEGIGKVDRYIDAGYSICRAAILMRHDLVCAVGTSCRVFLVATCIAACLLDDIEVGGY